MSQYYNPLRTKNIYNPKGSEPFRLSRSKIDLYLNCPRCFYLDRRLGVGQPPGFPFSLNSAVDTLLKKEFDAHRAKGQPHPLMKHYKINAIPLAHEKMDEWRDALRGGVTYYHEATNFVVTGAPDDLWVNPDGELIVVDYKATAKEGEVSLDAAWQIGYKRQMEVYQWLLRQNNFLVSNRGYFVYVNGQTDRAAFDAKLEFSIKVIPYTGDDSWIEPTLAEIKKTLNSSQLPAAHPDCDYCRYRQAAAKLE
ncbi:MAG: PD-(D/E)XK nuclease family protein [Candidatus Buchananbacteria bacterium]